MQLFLSGSSSSSSPAIAQSPGQSLQRVLNLSKLMPQQESAYTIKAKRVDKSIQFDVLKERDFTLFTASKIPRYEGKLKLIIDNVGLTDSNLNSLGRFATFGSDISHINLLQYHPDFQKFTPFLSDFPDLASIDLSSHIGPDQLPVTLDEATLAAGLSELARVCPNLTTINLQEQAQVTDRIVFTIADLFPKLRSINLSGCAQISDDSVMKLAERCPISSINLRGCIHITDGSIIPLANKNLLTSIDITQCSISDASLLAIQDCPNLKSIGLLECEEISSKAVKHLVKACRKLTSIELDGCTKVRDKAFQVMGTYCEDLTSISLNGCRSISNIGIKAIASRLITSIELSQCNRVTDVGIKVIALLCPNLTKISLWFCNEITDESMVEIGKGCRKMRSISFPPRITDASLLGVAKYCPDINELHFGNTVRITDLSIRAIAITYHENLREIFLQSCHEVADTAVAELGHCTNLVTLDLLYCHKITAGAVDALKGKLPNTTILHV